MFNITISDGVLFNNYLWFSNILSNGLYKINIKTRIIDFVDFFPGEKPMASALHKRCFIHKKKLFFLPALSRKIDIYDIQNKCFESIPYENDIEGDAILCAASIDENIYIFPRKASCVPLKINMSTLEAKEIWGLDKEINKYVAYNNPEKFYRVCGWNKSLLFGLTETDIIALWNPTRSTFKTYHTGITKIINITVKNNLCYFTSREQYGLYCLDFETEEVKYLDCGRPNNYDGNLYGDIIEWNNKIVAIPGFGNYIHIYDNNSLDFEHEVEKSIRDKYKFYRCTQVNGDIWLLPNGIDDFYILHKDYSVQEVEIKRNHNFEKNISKLFMEETLKEKHLLYETPTSRLNVFLDLIKEEKNEINT